MFTCLVEVQPAPGRFELLARDILSLDASKPVLGGQVYEQKGADQPAHPRSLINAFVIHDLESIISKLATGETSIF